ncbi:MAG: hypothetical protein LUB59_02840 [Candidatus Gastranaerophilales bacterium]|nr:hypothetical protein [Candidatus Gastranaerophilales bacterium]
MSIQPINSVSVHFTGKEKKTDNGNTYKSSSIAKTTGFVIGAAVAGGLMHSQLKALKTIKGKRNLIAGFHERGKSLNDVKERVIRRDEAGKIIPYEKGQVSDRTKSIVGGFKSTLAVWGAGITAATTIFGNLIDANINTSRAKQADIASTK